MTQLVNVTLPADQAEGSESVAGPWFKAVGESVAENEPLLEISTDKVTVEIAAPVSGVIAEILVPEGDPIEATTVLGRIAVGEGVGAPASLEEPDRPIAAQPVHPSTAPTDSDSQGPVTELSPAVRRLLAQHHLDPSAVAGTGRGRRITVQDVEGYLAEPAATSSAQPSVESPSHRIPHSTMRKRIAQHMIDSVRTAPHVTSVFQADLTAILADKERRRVESANVTLTAYFIRAAVEAIAAVPEVNSRWHEGGLEVFDTVNLGVATALESTGGLIVPVVKHAEALDLDQTAHQVRDLALRARENTLTPAEVQGGTFTLSNHGVSGSLIASPIIINQPQSAILGIGAMERRAMAQDATSDVIVLRPMVYVTLTIDHRVLDGHQANQFLTRFVEVLEGWA